MDDAIFLCPLCLLPIKPPISKCKGGHMGCRRCIGELALNPCKKCEKPVRLPPSNRSGAMVKCVHEGCQGLVTSRESYDHYITCLHGPYGYTEALKTGHSFTGPPRELLGHLFIGSGDEDGTVFAITVGTLGPATKVSCVCIRSATCLSPRYTAQLLVIGPPAPAPAGTSDLSTDTLMAVIEPMSSLMPSLIALQQLTSFLAVPPWYVRENGGQRVLPVCVCIKKKIIP